jgi:hypothetical protein
VKYLIRFVENIFDWNFVFWTVRAFVVGGETAYLIAIVAGLGSIRSAQSRARKAELRTAVQPAER